MKFKKLQQGGLLSFTGVTNSAPFAPPGTPSGASGGSKDETQSGYEDIIKELLLKGEGLSNDVYHLVNQMQQLESSSNTPYLSGQGRSNYLALYGQVNAIKRNKERWESAYKTAESSGGLNEVAIGSSGELYAIDQTGAIQATTISDYKKSKGKLRLLSVAELLKERDENPLLTNNNGILSVADNSISMKSIHEYAKSVATSLGTESEESEFIVNKQDALSRKGIIEDQVRAGNRPSQDTIKGFEILQHVSNSPSNYAKVKQTNSSERNHALKAVNYIWSTLGENAKHKLRVQSELAGQKPDDLLLDLIVMSTDTTSSYAIDPISDAKATKGSDGGEDLTGAKNMNQTQMMMSGTLSSGQHFVFNDPEYNSKFSGLIMGKTPTITPDNKANSIGATTLSGLLFSGYSSLVETDNIYFGNNKVTRAQLEDVIIDGMADVAYVLLPSNLDGSPDNQSLEEYKILIEKYKADKDNMTVSQIKRMFSNSGFTVDIDENKEISVSKTGTNVKPFLITFGYTNDGSSLPDDNDDPNNGGLRKLNREESKGMARFEEQAWTLGSGRNVENWKPKTNIFNRSRYKGVIYMPVRHGGSVIADAIPGAGPKKPAYSDAQVRFTSQNSSNSPYVKANINELNNE